MKGRQHMKFIGKMLFLLASSAFLFACSNPSQTTSSSAISPEDVSFPDRPEDVSYQPGPNVDPSEGDPAIPGENIGKTPMYFDNTSLHSLPGQWNGYGVHHPSIFHFDGVYYLYLSTPSASVGIRAMKSPDLIHWSLPTEAGFPLGYISKDKITYGAQAPQVIRFGEEFLLYFKSAKGYAVLSSSSPEGPFAPAGELDFDSSYLARPFMAPNGKLFLLSGGEKAVEVYEMPTPFSVDSSSRSVIEATARPGYSGGQSIADFPSISDIEGTAYLTYSAPQEHLVSYRSYLASAINPDYSSSHALAASFFQQGQGPALVQTDERDGSRGLGDLQFVQGPDMVSHCAFYTSYVSANERAFNLAPISFSSANVSFSHRDEGSFLDLQPVVPFVDKAGEVVLSEEETDEAFSASFCFEKAESLYFGYKTKNNHYRVDFDEENGQGTLLLMENGLLNELGKFPLGDGAHEVEIAFDGALSLTIDGVRHVAELPLHRIPQGKIGYRKSGQTRIGTTFFVSSSPRLAAQNAVKAAEAPLYAGAAWLSESKLDEASPLPVIRDERLDFHGSSYLNLSSAKDYARFLIDVKEAGRYGVELIFNASFAAHRSVLGIRIGEGDELVYQTSPIGESGYVRALTVEAETVAGPQELLIENLSSDLLHLISARLVRVSSSSPSFSDPLSSYAEKGVYYVTDFRLNASYKAHETYEGARCFAYVGDDTITDFVYSAEVGFLGGVSTSGFVSLNFRCRDYASSSYDDNESLIGYSLEISQYQTRLVKHNYGFGETIGVLDLVNSIGDFRVFQVQMKGNALKVYRDETLLFRYEDPMAFSSGHLGFGSNDTNGLIRKLAVSPIEE